ncbi:MAG: tetratricopeptide repeat protein [Bacteroidales bacterium]
MKRLMLTAAIAVLMFGTAFAQVPGGVTPILLNKSTLQKKVEKSDEHIVHERKGAKERTWRKRGELFQDVDNQGLEQVQLGMDQTTVKLLYNEPKSVETKEDVEILTYETINYFFENNRLRGWTRIDPIHENPLQEALRSYKKAIELIDEGEKMKTQERIKDNLVELKLQFQRDGQNQYYHENYLASLKAFESIHEVNEIPIFDGVIDTLMINYCGIVAREIGVRYAQEGKEQKAEEMYRKAIDYYDQLSDLGFGGASNYIQMTRDYYAIGDTLGAIDNLKKGLEQYPDSTLLVTVAAQAYYLMKDNEKGLEFLDERLEKRPKCPAAYYWKGLLITNVKDVEEELIKESLALYDTSLMYDPSNASVWYQSGYVNYAVGASYYEQESYEEDAEFRKLLNEKGKKYYVEAAEKMEKAYELSVDDRVVRREALDLLKRIYYKLYGSDDEHYLRTNERLKEF